MMEIAEWLANKQYGTRGLPRFRPPEGKPYSCLSALDYGGTEGYRGAQIRSGVEVCTREYESRSRSCPSGLYIEIGRSQAQIESVTGFRVYPFEFPIYSSLALQGSEGIMGLGHPKVFMGRRIFAVGLPWARLGMLRSCTRGV